MEIHSQRRIKDDNMDNILEEKTHTHMHMNMENRTNSVSPFVINVESEVMPSLMLRELP